MTPHEDEGRGSRRRRVVFRYIFYYFIACYTKVFIGLSYYSSTTAMNDATLFNREDGNEGRGLRQRRVVSTPRCTATSDATGGQKRGERLETIQMRLEPQVRFYIYVFYMLY